MTSQDYVQAATGVFAAFMRGDIEGFLDAMADDVVLVSAPGTDEIPWHGIRRGKEEIRAHLGLVNEHIEVSLLEQSDLLTAENKVAVVNHMECEVKKSGEKVTVNELVHILTFNESGQVSRWIDVYDGTKLLMAFRR